MARETGEQQSLEVQAGIYGQRRSNSSRLFQDQRCGLSLQGMEPDGVDGTTRPGSRLQYGSTGRKRHTTTKWKIDAENYNTITTAICVSISSKRRLAAAVISPEKCRRRIFLPGRLWTNCKQFCHFGRIFSDKYCVKSRQGNFWVPQSSRVGRINVKAIAWYSLAREEIFYPKSSLASFTRLNNGYCL